jgi:hypothetical protein
MRSRYKVFLGVDNDEKTSSQVYKTNTSFSGKGYFTLGETCTILVDLQQCRTETDVKPSLVSMPPQRAPSHRRYAEIYRSPFTVELAAKSKMPIVSATGGLHARCDVAEFW